MKWQRCAIACLGALTMSLISSPAFAECAQGERISGECSSVYSSHDGEEVTIEREEYEPGWQADPEYWEESTDEASEDFLPGSAGQMFSEPEIRLEAELGSAECDIRVAGLCRGQAPSKDTAEGELTSTVGSLSPPTPPRYASELRTFRPQRPSLLVEPSGWSLPSLPLNAVALTGQHTVRGKLLGWPVRVRFTPVAYHWSFGDGAEASTSHPGNRLSSLGLRKFDSTSSSHRYLRPGTYTVSLRVDYRVDFRFEQGTYRRLSGFVTATAPSVSVTVLTVSPLLVER